MAHHQHVRLHGVQRHAVSIRVSPLRIDEEPALHVDHVGAQPLAGQFERGLGAGGGLEEQVDQGAAAQRGPASCRLARLSSTNSSAEVEQARRSRRAKALRSPTNDVG